MTNADVARAFFEIADLLEIGGEKSFRITSYRRAARAISDLAEDITDIASRGELAKIEGIGKSSVAKIEELLETGQLAYRDELAEKVPLTTLELLKIPNMGPKKVALLFHEKGVDSLASLQAAIDAGSLSDLKGFGPKSIEKIREGIDFLSKSSGRTRLGAAWPLAERVREAVRQMPGVQRVEHAGSLRRGRETVGDLDLLCIADNGAEVVERFTQLDVVDKVLAAGDTKGSIRTNGVDHPVMQIDLRVVPAENFGAAWQYFTGSKEHNVRLRELAVRRGWSLNEYSLSEGDKTIASATEEEIYAALDVAWVPPELRENRGEFDLDQAPDDLLTPDDIRGDLHLHTTASDGRFSIVEMAEAARARGYEYICVTDHSKSSVVANGLAPERLLEHIEAIREANEQVDGIEILAGSEVDILADDLDYEDDLLAQLDWVVASNHHYLGDDRDENTARALRAIAHPCVNAIGHPTGRIIGKRSAKPLDMGAIAKAAAESGTALEINAAHQRLDLKDQHARLAIEQGAALTINCDAHHINGFNQLVYGVLTARRGWVRTHQVVNTWPLDKLRAFVTDKRKRG